MTTCDTNTNKSDIMFQITALNKAIIKLKKEKRLSRQKTHE